MGRGWPALAVAALLVAPGVPLCQGTGDLLSVPHSTADRVELSTLIFSRNSAPRLFTGELTISGIDPKDIRRTLDAYNRRSKLAQFTRESLVVAPFVLQRAFEMEENQLLQVRLSARTARLVFEFTWR